MSIETRSLPVFETAYGRIVSPRRTVPELRYGFVLHEQAPAGHHDVHAEHTRAASRLLAYAGIAPRWQEFPERLAETFPEYSPRHVDGLEYQYFQVHTTHNDPTGGRSEMHLQWYELDGRERDALRQQRHLAPSGSSQIEVGYIASPSCPTMPGLPRLLDEPDGRACVTAGPNQTIVFPNGYDARSDNTASLLFVHAFGTVSADGEADSRTVSISRLEPAV